MSVNLCLKMGDGTSITLNTHIDFNYISLASFVSYILYFIVLQFGFHKIVMHSVLQFLNNRQKNH